MFSAEFIVLSRFSTVLGKLQAISGPGQIKIKSPGFSGSAGNPETRFCHMILPINY